MTAIERAPRSPFRAIPLASVVWPAAGLLALAVAVRASEARGALVYPDGYQYLLMARGIAQHLRPVIQLGAHGEQFTPNADAALKPLFPALVALLHTAGLGWTVGARAISVLAGAATVVLTGLVAGRLTASRACGAFAALVVLLDPVVRYWAAFSSPDALGAALTLAALLAVLHGRTRSAGILAGLALFARPELGALLVAGGAVLTLRAPARNRALGFLTSAFLTGTLVLVVLRPPLQLSQGEVALGLGGALAASALGLLAPPQVAVVSGLALIGLAGANGTAVVNLAVHDPVVVALFLGGVLAAGRSRPTAVAVVAAGALMLAFETRNGTSSRYMAELVPLAAIVAALGLRRVRRAAAAITASACLVALALAQPAAAPGPDMFGAVARELPLSSEPISTSAPDAYGFLLYPRSVRALEPGSRGLLLVDATTRAYEPGITTRGRVVARLAPANGFVDPNGTIDVAPAHLIEGSAR